ncbi:hypothetical protein AB1Y20_017241 [Prymnesium parvum]|uniref:Uncharacterized protein n=1 Tax=Prymnesium parvum TaxID=97485 RepID=A0AB34JL26_PRYPA
MAAPGEEAEAPSWMEEDESILMHYLEAEEVETAQLAQAIAISADEAEARAMEEAVANSVIDAPEALSAPADDVEARATEDALARSVREAREAVAASAEDAERARHRFEAHGIFTREDFVPAMARVLQLAVSGMAGCLHSLKSLRNLELRRFTGDQAAAQSHVAQTDTSASVEDPDVISACLRGIGLPLALALPMWQRLRRLGLLCELRGHDVGSMRGRLLCMLCGVPTDAEPMETAAIHSLWFMLCQREVLAEAEVDQLVTALVMRDADAAIAAHQVFSAIGQHPISESDWKGVAPEQVSATRARIIARQLLKDPERAERARERIRAGV